MIYVYQSGGRWVVSRNHAPKGIPHITLKRMIVTPQKQGHDAILRADINTGRVWFDLVENIDGARVRIIAAIETHDKSPAVNSFTVGGAAMWLDREERTSLARTITLAAEAGERTFAMWTPGAPGVPPVSFGIPIEMAGPMLDALELYAKATYNVTQSHKAAVYALATAAEIEAYDYTAGYPARLEFTL